MINFLFRYGLDFVTQAVDWTNDKYGALDIAVSRVVFVHGSVDPWHVLGITTTKDNDAPAIYIHGKLSPFEIFIY